MRLQIPICSLNLSCLIEFLVVFHLVKDTLKDLLIPGRRVSLLVEKAGNLGFEFAFDAVIVHPVGI